MRWIRKEGEAGLFLFIHLGFPSTEDLLRANCLTSAGWRRSSTTAFHWKITLSRIPERIVVGTAVCSGLQKLGMSYEGAGTDPCRFLSSKLRVPGPAGLACDMSAARPAARGSPAAVPGLFHKLNKAPLLEIPASSSCCPSGVFPSSNILRTSPKKSSS